MECFTGFQKGAMIVKRFGMNLLWLENILKKASEISDDEINSTNWGRIERGETVIGEVSPSILRLGLLRVKTHDQAARMAQNHVETTHADDGEVDEIDHGNCKRFYEDIARLKMEYDIIHELFWYSIRSEFGLIDEPIGIRENATIVALSQENKDEEEQEVLQMGVIPEGLARIIFGGIRLR